MPCPIYATSSSTNCVDAESKRKFSFDNCSTLCTPKYGWFECMTDCYLADFNNGGDCASPSPKEPKRCCCQK
ncbi:hypothetical protein CARUB_v10015183mg [Capsella rubella]|uniref:Defensin-like domain-containing protein n=1 Tax=Capsella rubella TaxID=81985 RepID=R0I6A6_9BRAS|nr:hypothetical protein CARUB_v10015183mg [Capsella rubella]